MQVQVLNHSSFSFQEAQVVTWTKEIFRILSQKQIKPSPSVSLLTIVFKDTKDMQVLNKQFRSKDQVTDVLSFHPLTSHCLGEIVLAVQKVQSQAKQNQHSFFHEIGYLILHGVLHLLGYEHELGGEKEKEMMDLQETVFEQLRAIFP